MGELKEFGHRELGVKNPYNREALEAMMEATPSRIATGRVGSRPPVGAWLSFRLDEAAAKDAVWTRISDEFLTEHGVGLRVETICTDKHEYLAHPEKGGILTKEAETAILAHCTKGAQIQVFMSEGLSSSAVMENLPDLLPALKHGFETAGLTFGTPFYVDNGRVRLLNDVCRVLQPEVAIMLIGERPGLVTQTSLSAYMAYRAKMTDTDGERNASRTSTSWVSTRWKQQQPSSTWQSACWTRRSAALH